MADSADPAIKRTPMLGGNCVSEDRAPEADH
jgi:hypothetical protein